MNINATSSDVMRQLLLANPELAHCKGSIKAVRMMLNMLGFKCIIVTDQFLTYNIFDNDKDITPTQDLAYVDCYNDDVSVINDQLDEMRLQLEELKANAENPSVVFYCISELTDQFATHDDVSDKPTLETVKILLTNVRNEDLDSVKDVLAKQLREILPINKIVTAKDIIGYCVNE